MEKLNQNFFRNDSKEVAKNLLGKIMIRKIQNNTIKTKIVETEAYGGSEDKASHAHQNKRTKRTEPMFWQGGYIYIYQIYGLYHCLNIVTGKKDKPHAVLIRAVEPLTNLDTIKKYREIKKNIPENLTNGPGKLCQALQIDKNLNEIKLTKTEKLFIRKHSTSNTAQKIKSSPRINIDYAEEYKDKNWRYYLKDNPFVSR